MYFFSKVDKFQKFWRKFLEHLKIKNKGVSIITESLKPKQTQDDSDKNTMLDENNIL